MNGFVKFLGEGFNKVTDKVRQFYIEHREGVILTGFTVLGGIVGYMLRDNIAMSKEIELVNEHIELLKETNLVLDDNIKLLDRNTALSEELNSITNSWLSQYDETIALIEENTALQEQLKNK